MIRTLVAALVCLCLTAKVLGLPENRVKRAPVFTSSDPTNPAGLMQPLPPDNMAKIPEKPKPIKIAESPECLEDVQRLCADKAKANNFIVLDCLQDSISATESLSSQCDHYLWNYKKKLSKDIRFDRALDEACSPELEKIPDCKKLQKGEGKIIPCLIDHYEQVKSKPCHTFLNKMASIIFSDFHFMDFFMKNCSQDIERTQCGRIENLEPESTSSHQQGKTIFCLNLHRKNLTKTCKKALLRVAELQSDDYHLDRPLYYSCKADRENLCHDVVSGNGAVFKCLYKHLGDPKLTPDCKEKLEARQALIAEDVKADKSFYTACGRDIEENQCLKKNDNSDDEVDDNLRRSSVLLCLEEAQSDGEKKVSPMCIQAMFELRSELMQDFKISPELVSSCEKEIVKECKGLDAGGYTINCLMKLAVVKHKGGDEPELISSKCKAQLNQLLHVANPGEDIRLDLPLQRACGDVVTKACHDLQAGHGDVITCLLENIDHEDMTDECEEQLLLIQYFAVRDFRLDNHLFKQCQKDALQICKSNGYADPNTMEPEHGPLVFSCLHRAMRSKNSNDMKPSRGCVHEIKRVLRERSTRVKLIPEVEEACMKDLAEICSEEEHKQADKEMECLQDNFDDLGERCKAVVANFTEEEMEDIEMDRILMKACTPMIKTFCRELLNSDAMPNEVLDCLIEHKNNLEMDDKCAAGIEHHQIISMKDFRFNHKFREACQIAVGTYCTHKKTKYEVVACLSEHVRNDTLLEKEQRIEAGCQKQLKFELLQRGESINLDPKLKAACSEDISKFCKSKKQGEGEIIECLRGRRKKLAETCHVLLFQREKDEALFGDYTVHHLCRKMIQKFCAADQNEDDIMSCLKSNKNAIDFDDRCRQIVLRRQIEQSQDYRLNPHLQKACRLDIPKYCSQLYDGVSKDKEMDGVVIDCLKKQYAKKANSLSTDCEHEIKAQIKEAALDINLNPVLMKTCKSD
ncbi:Golgi apparatus protein 1, partial [Biomphalaria pfeifferi]